LRALAAAPLPNLTSLSLSHACLSAADVSGVLSKAPWLPRLTSLELASNPLGAPGHRALSLLHLPRLQAFFLAGAGRNCFGCAGLAALVSAPWLTQLCKLTLVETEFIALPQSCDDVCAALKDDDWVFGRLRRLGCIVDYRKTIVQGDSDDEITSDLSDA
jgi:hypothetical protein